MYDDKIVALGTMHEKEKVISPLFFDVLGLKVVHAKIDTDQLGTFTGEVEREGSSLHCVRKKCELAMKQCNSVLGVASEGSFGPHPVIPFAACDHEILYFIDQERGFELHQSLFSTRTNYRQQAISDYEVLKVFCEQTLFPSHAIIVRPNKTCQKNVIFKGVQRLELLKEAFLRCCALSDDGIALVETDMRAHMNPTRMEVIKELANSFVKRLATPCPQCVNPGWGLVNTQKGLACQECGVATDMIKFEVFGCPKCSYKELRSRQDGIAFADARYCGICNP